MARTVYSLRIFAHAGLSPAGSPVGPTVPTGLLYVVRDIDAFSNTGAVGDDLVAFSPVAGVLWRARLAASGNPLIWTFRGRQVYAEGETVGFQSLQGTWSVTCSGYQLTLP